jgi:dTDP-4-amino-4,6-dideoxygalactose transaminase
MPGTNAKMNEMQALMGSMMLGHMEMLLQKRKRIYEIYQERLGEVPGITFSPDPERGVEYNYAYVPVLIDEQEFGMSRDVLYEKLKEYNVFARRYFYPLLNDFSCYQSVVVSKPMDVARRVSEQVITLPTYCDLGEDEVHQICDIIAYLRK